MVLQAPGAVDADVDVGQLCHASEVACSAHEFLGFARPSPELLPTSFLGAGTVLRGIANVLFGGPKGPLLGGCKVRLGYTTTGVRYADVDGSNICGGGPPSVKFKKNFVTVHAHAEDQRTGEVLWDVDLRRSSPGKKLPRRRLTKAEGQTGTMLDYKAPCTDRDDPYPHRIDISFRTKDGTWNDKEQTEWDHDKMEGFANFRGPSEHVGFEVYRLPRLEPIPWKYFGSRKFLNPINSLTLNPFKRNPLTKHVYREIVGPQIPPRRAWKRARPGMFSKGPRHDLAFERFLNDEEDPRQGKYDYYSYIPKRNGLFDNNYNRNHRFGPPRLIWSRYGAGEEGFLDTRSILTTPNFSF
mmetsp:Transcript_60113/g.143254  ORF Transcript_60113/g.143254 Transcript_60113/m.143254 type:complete len:354 (-) Transcript_60113:20-1081(-)